MGTGLQLLTPPFLPTALHTQHVDTRVRPLDQQHAATPEGLGLLYDTGGRTLLSGGPAAGLSGKVGHSQGRVPGF